MIHIENHMEKDKKIEIIKKGIFWKLRAYFIIIEETHSDMSKKRRKGY